MSETKGKRAELPSAGILYIHISTVIWYRHPSTIFKGNVAVNIAIMPIFRNIDTNISGVRSCVLCRVFCSRKEKEKGGERKKGEKGERRGRGGERKKGEWKEEGEAGGRWEGDIRNMRRNRNTRTRGNVGNKYKEFPLPLSPLHWRVYSNRKLQCRSMGSQKVVGGNKTVQVRKQRLSK